MSAIFCLDIFFDIDTIKAETDNYFYQKKKRNSHCNILDQDHMFACLNCLIYTSENVKLLNIWHFYLKNNLNYSLLILVIVSLSYNSWFLFWYSAAHPNCPLLQIYFKQTAVARHIKHVSPCQPEYFGSGKTHPAPSVWKNKCKGNHELSIRRINNMHYEKLKTDRV